jgi:hypothetical protein
VKLTVKRDLKISDVTFTVGEILEVRISGYYGIQLFLRHGDWCWVYKRDEKELEI